MKPNMNIALDGSSCCVEIYFDVGSKNYGVRKMEQVIKDGVYLSAEKHIDMTVEQLEKLVEQAKHFIGVHKKYP